MNRTFLAAVAAIALTASAGAQQLPVSYGNPVTLEQAKAIVAAAYEFHYSLYEKGDFYLPHYDQFQNNSSRKYSMISYLNNDWQPKDGGELLIHQENNNQKIAPTQGKTVFFKSDELLHEVLVTQNTRMSITGWLKCN